MLWNRKFKIEKKIQLDRESHAGIRLTKDLIYAFKRSGDDKNNRTSPLSLVNGRKDFHIFIGVQNEPFSFSQIIMAHSGTLKKNDKLLRGIFLGLQQPEIGNILRVCFSNQEKVQYLRQRSKNNVNLLDNEMKKLENL